MAYRLYKYDASLAQLTSFNGLAPLSMTIVNPTPTISFFSPSSAVVGTTVTINGTTLTGATAVKFGNVAATSFTVKSATQITAVVPASAVTGKITVVTPAGTVTSTGTFTVTVAPPPGGDYGGTSGWTLLHTYDLTRDEGWTQTSGTRPGADSSYNRASQTTFDSTGMTITAQRASDTATIYSSDAQARFLALPDHFAIEADINLMDYLGEGMFPAMWWRPLNASNGELDGFEYCGAYDPNGTASGDATNTDAEMKMTLIKTAGDPNNYNLGSVVVKFAANGAKARAPWNGTFAGFHRWRYEKTPGQIAMWVDGILIATITRATFDSKTGTGAWNTYIEYGATWYTRLTYQVGRGVKNNLGGAVPAGWRSSRMNISRLVAYK